MNITPRTCPLCKGDIEKGYTIFTAKIGEGILVIENVPVDLCMLCGEKWFSDEIVEKIEKISASTRANKIRFEVLTFDVA